MNSLEKLLILALSIIGLTSCNPKFYTPNTQNVPLITEQGETNLTLSGNNNQVEFQGAYGITENIAIKANGGLFIPPDLDNGNGGGGNFVEFGGGYFKSLPNSFVFETYALIGIGSFENHLPSTITNYPQTQGDISARILRLGIQPNFGYKTRNFSAAISSRLVSLNYSNIEGDLIFEDVDQIKFLEDNAANFLIEPALTLRGGFEEFRIQLQFGYSLNVSNAEFRQDNSYLTLGLNFNFK